DLAQEALTEAVAAWPESGVPANPAGWLMTVAKRRAIDAGRRRERFDERIAALGRSLEDEQVSGSDALPWDPDAIDDDVLRLVFISCHPVLRREAQLALTLRVVGGLTSEEIARAFLVPVSTIQQRIVRAKKALAAADVPFALPPADE
ncbi:RNA polymerase subunit sigma-24, partial [Burkholderia multivorans]